MISKKIGRSLPGEDLQQQLAGRFRPRSCRPPGCAGACSRPGARRGRAGGGPPARSRFRSCPGRAGRWSSGPRSCRRCRSVVSAMCWMPSPRYWSRYSAIWLLSSLDSLMGCGSCRRGWSWPSSGPVLAVDVEVADLAEVEQALVEVGPFLHAATVHVVRQVVDHAQAIARTGWAAPRACRRRPSGHEVDVIDRDVADVARLGAPSLAIPAVHRSRSASRRCPDGGDVQLHQARLVVDAPGAQFQRALVGGVGILHAEGHGADGGAMVLGEVLGERVLRRSAGSSRHLAVQRDVLGTVLGDGLEAHALEEGGQLRRVQGRRTPTNSKPSVPIGLSQGLNCM